jgi:hypothetical protein
MATFFSRLPFGDHPTLRPLRPEERRDVGRLTEAVIICGFGGSAEAAAVEEGYRRVLRDEQPRL